MSRRCIQCGRDARYQAYDGASGGFDWTCGAYPSCRAPQLIVEGVEPQEGAPDREVAGAEPTDRDSAADRGVPSCDSELAAIKARVAEGYLNDEDCDTLLRMVDELTSERDGIKHAWSREDAEWHSECEGLVLDLQTALAERCRAETERDDLRAKLDAALTHASAADDKHRLMRDKLDELEAKLAEAEHWRARHCEESQLYGEQSHRNWKTAETLRCMVERIQGERDAAEQRAEAAAAAAEARCRELEAQNDELIDQRDRWKALAERNAFVRIYRDRWKAAAKVFWTRWSHANGMYLDAAERRDKAEEFIETMREFKFRPELP